MHTLKIVTSVILCHNLSGVGKSFPLFLTIRCGLGCQLCIAVMYRISSMLGFVQYNQNNV